MLLLALTGIAVSGSALAPERAAALTGFVTRNGTSLELNGRPYHFDGVNIYNANSDGDGDPASCWYALDSGTGLATSLSDMKGGEVIRAWFFQGFAITNGVWDFSRMDHTLSVAASHNFRVIATLTNQGGTCDGNDGRKTRGWYQGGYKTRVDPGYLITYRQWVHKIVSHFKTNPTILTWQLINEAQAISGDGTCNESVAATAMRAFTDDVGGLAHSLDPNHLVNLGTTGSGQCGTSGPDYRYVHGSPGTDLCEYQDYGAPTTAMPGDSFNGLQKRLDQCGSLNKPLFVGETGISRKEVAGDLSLRAQYFSAKFNAQFAAGVQGECIWDWDLFTRNGGDGYVVKPGDPALALLTMY